MSTQKSNKNQKLGCSPNILLQHLRYSYTQDGVCDGSKSIAFYHLVSPYI